MARHKEFDSDQALDNAMQVFWKKGFQATSIRDLVEATGVNRASLYGTFGGKHELFQKALGRFQNADEQDFYQITKQGRPGLDRIRSAFRHIARQTLSDPRGCLVVNAVAEGADLDPTLARAGKASRQKIEQFFHACLKQAVKAGEIPAARDIRALARFLTNTLFGLRMMAKMKPDPKLVDDVIATALSAIN